MKQVRKTQTNVNETEKEREAQEKKESIGCPYRSEQVADIRHAKLRDHLDEHYPHEPDSDVEVANDTTRSCTILKLWLNSFA